MRFLFDPNSKIMLFISRFADLVVLNLVFLLTCIPVFTIGAANSALYDTVFRMDTAREGKLLSTYFRAFRTNFKQSTAIWLLLLLFGAATYVNMVQFSAFGGSFGYLLFLFSMLVLVILLMIYSYSFPLLSQFRNSIPQTIKNALLLAVANLPRTAVVLVVNCFPWILALVNLYAFVKLGFLWFSLYFAAAAYVNSRVLYQVFLPYMEHEQK